MCVIHNSKAVEGSARQRESTCGPVAPLEARAAPFAGRPSRRARAEAFAPEPTRTSVLCHNVRASLFQLSSTSRAQCHLAGAELHFSQRPSSPWFLTPELARRAAVPRRTGLSSHLATCWCPSPCCPQVGSGRGQAVARVRGRCPRWRRQWGAPSEGSPLRGAPHVPGGRLGRRGSASAAPTLALPFATPIRVLVCQCT